MKAKILIVDDEEITRATLVDIIRLAGYDAVAEPNGLAAVERLEKEKFDLLLLDLKMPGMSGMDVLRVSNQIAPTMAVILLTAHGSMETAIEALRLRVHDFLVKPAIPEQILESIRKGLGFTKIFEAPELYSFSAGPESPGEPPDQLIRLENGMVADFNRRFILCDHEKVHLTPTEARLLRVFLERPGQVISHQDIVSLAQGYDTRGWEASEILRPLISRLRRKLSVFKEGKGWITSVRGSGYIWEGARISG